MQFLKSIKKYIEQLLLIPCRTSIKGILRVFTLLAFILIICTSCNLCPTGPDGNGDNTAEEVYSTIIPLNSNVPIITKISINSYLFSEILSNGYLFSAPANNGNFAFIRIDEKESKKVLMIGNIFDYSSQVLDKEGKDFSIFYPTISQTGNKIAFLGGGNQLFIWVLNENSKSSYIDKISTKVFDNVVPEFSNDASKLAFLENENDSNVKLKIIDTQNPDEIIFQKSFVNEKIINGFDNYLSFSNDSQKLAFLTQTDSTDIIKIVDLIKSDVKEIRINKTDLGIKIARISPSGKYIAITAEDGNIWIISGIEETPLFNKITNVKACNYFLYFDWNASSNKLLAQSFNCNDEIAKGSTLYVIELKEENEIVLSKSTSLFCNNIQRAYWKR